MAGDEMELNSRKIQILQAIIMNYLETAEPVGSRTISRRFPLGISSATIRNEMSDLEELGFIMQPHTSAGRIPSSKGYRLYVDHLMRTKSISSEQMEILKRILREKRNQLDSLLKEMGDLLADLTRYTAIVTMPQFKKTRLKHLQLIALDHNSVILVIITDGNVVRNNVLQIEQPFSQEDLYRLSEVLNTNLSGLTVEEINLPLIQKIKREMKVDQTMMDGLLDAINETLQFADDVDVFTSGATNILNFPEFADIARARALMEVFEEKEQMLSMVHSSLSGKSPMSITIGTENAMEELQDCSIITAIYHYGKRNIGSISVVGPMRMDYDQVASTLGCLVKDFQQLFSEDKKAETEAKSKSGIAENPPGEPGT